MTAAGTRPADAGTGSAGDPHLATGAYDPEAYWSARAAHGDREDLETVCIFGASADVNRGADRVQRRALQKALAPLSLAGADVLEYGCGIGRWAPVLTARGARWHGVDLSAGMCEHARRNVPAADVRKLAGGSIPHDDGAFDLVYSVTVVHHNPYEEQEQIVDEMLRVLRPGGTLVLFEDLGTRGAFNMFPRPLAGWADLLADRGFAMAAHRGVRYSILRGALARLRQRLGPSPGPAAAGDEGAGAASSPPSRLHRLVDRVDCLVDPWLAPLLPARLHTSAVMTFRAAAP